MLCFHTSVTCCHTRSSVKISFGLESIIEESTMEGVKRRLSLIWLLVNHTYLRLVDAPQYPPPRCRHAISHIHNLGFGQLLRVRSGTGIGHRPYTCDHKYMCEMHFLYS
jgi:hypothetical protein